ncbi:ATP-binding cassette domain-containing protein [Microbacterium sp. ET2]|uniref:ABC transporter ATP-binding protein n=1 Tax=Microbacterium albipurpureum TaxID=3050384 RepID=UPI00259CE635|nr:ATP-binding cassette domain-containing protein [Microbacterium sp. ET2 (Ac-2212)]WJL96815.1 ATP-binding cassette domain-containing protein [Microbacterium sp. ET2 (Ac-2212)]
MDSTGTRPGALEARGWGWRHASRRAWALNDVTLRIDPGERVLLLGASGAGKSTLLHGFAGVLGEGEDGEQAGELLIDGMPAADARGRAGLVLQDPDAQVILARVGDDVAFGCENLGVPRADIWPRVGAALDAVGLDVPLDRPTKALSGGQKQRLALAGALAMRPGILLLDEPTANLDPAGVIEVRDAVARVAAESGMTLVVVEHRVEAWLGVVDRVIVLGGPDRASDVGGAGGVIADGAPDEVLRRDGAAVAAQGVWVPGWPPRHPAPAPLPPGRPLLEGDDLAVARVRDTPVARVERAVVRERGVLAITGPNGVGKSTLGLTLAGLLPAASGALVATETLADGAGPTPIRWSSRALLTRIGTVFQEPEHQLLTRTVRDELAVGPRALGLADPDVEARVDDLLRRLRLDHLGAANPYTLSGGEKRRLTVAAAIATRPRVLVLDEPTFGQDARTWSELVALLADLRDAGTAIVAITHDREVVRALGADELEMGAVG